MLKILFAAFLVLHGAIHLSYVSPRPPATAGGPAWPFSLDSSWILTPLGVGSDLGRALGVALAAVTIVAFALAAASVLGLLPPGLWSIAVGIGAASSIALLVLFFHPWLVLGIVIDVVLLAALWLGDWSPQTLGG